jgi:hypothetical protein
MCLNTLSPCDELNKLFVIAKCVICGGENAQYQEAAVLKTCLSGS